MAAVQIHDPSFKGGLTVDLGAQIIYANITKGKFASRILSENIITLRCGMAFPRDHRLFPIIDKKIEQLITGGILNYYQDDLLEFLKPKRYEHLYPKMLRVVSMKDLEEGFVVWLISVSVACIAFVFEWLMTFYVYIVWKRILAEMYKHRHQG